MRTVLLCPFEYTRVEYRGNVVLLCDRKVEINIYDFVTNVKVKRMWLAIIQNDNEDVGSQGVTRRICFWKS